MTDTQFLATIDVARDVPVPERLQIPRCGG